MKWHDAKENPPKKSGDYLAFLMKEYCGYHMVLYYSAFVCGWNCNELSAEPRAHEIKDVVAWAELPAESMIMASIKGEKDGGTEI